MFTPHKHTYAKVWGTLGVATAAPARLEALTPIRPR